LITEKDKNEPPCRKLQGIRYQMPPPLIGGDKGKGVRRDLRQGGGTIRKPCSPAEPGFPQGSNKVQGIMNLAACGGTFLTGLKGLTRFSLYPEHPVYPV